jgi:hypothetical protein
MSAVPISDKALDALTRDYAWYCKDPIGTPSGRLELLCSRIEAVIEEYEQTKLSLLSEPYNAYE